jgi:peptidoglycan/xylan/chitin deacetylase (PgdA/CDA1 family)
MDHSDLDRTERDRGNLDRIGSTGVNRRGFLAALAGVVAAGVAACGDSGPTTSLDGRTATSVPPTTAASTTTTTTAPAKGPAHFVSTGSIKAPSRVALTFHTSGDLTLAQRLLDVLAAHHTPITAFIVGSWLDANPTWGKKLTDAGHELANHTYTHPTFGSLAPAAMLSEITRCRDVLVRLTGSGGTYFRPSGTDDGVAAPSPAVLDAAWQGGYPTVLGFDVDPLDYQDPGATVVTQRTLAAVKAGSIVSLHFDHAGTVDALPAILDGLVAKGLTPVTASKLLAA